MSAKPSSLTQADAFDRFYRGPLKSAFEDLTAQREAIQRAANSRLKWSLTVAAIVALFLLELWRKEPGSSIPLFSFVGIIVAAGFELRRQYLKKFGLQVKETILPAILNHYGEFAVGVSNKYEAIVRDNIEPILPCHDSLIIDDVIVGHYRGTALVFVEATAKHDDNGSGSPVFEGIIIEARHATGLTGDYALTWQALDWEFPDLLSQGKKGERIRLESPAFEKSFNFYGHDQIEGRTLMTPRLMDAWTALEAYTNRFGLAAQFGPDFVRIKMGRRSDWIDDAILDDDRTVEDTIKAIINDLEALLTIVDLACFAETDADIAAQSSH